ncbi:MAG TPA: hypothetical protein VMW72_05660 [Sedimentisphaerales bacterium]|nr:hypothetical protein [Sedimentisphaerales bacterium]
MAEPELSALNGSAVTHDNPNAAQINTWTQWTIGIGPVCFRAIADKLHIRC